VCIDPKDLNGVLRRSHYPTPTIEILPEISRAKVFSTVDAENGFWHVELDNNSSHLTTFNSPFGRFHWRCLPFGLCTAPEESQRRLNHALEGLTPYSPNLFWNLIKFSSAKILKICRIFRLKDIITKLLQSFINNFNL